MNILKKWWFWIVIVLVILFITFIYPGLIWSGGPYEMDEEEYYVEMSRLCVGFNSNGTWLEEYKECEGWDFWKQCEIRYSNNLIEIMKNCEALAEDFCEGIGDTFESCASPCRHNPDSNVACAAVCVPVCSFDYNK